MDLEGGNHLNTFKVSALDFTTFFFNFFAIDSELCNKRFVLFAVQKESWRTVLTLAYQSLGVVYGDLSTSPLYVYKSTFAEDIKHSETNEEIYGVLSFVFWTLTLIPLLKYVFIVLRANDNGEGGTFALYSLLCRHARVGFLPNGQLADEELSAYKKTGSISRSGEDYSDGEAGGGGRLDTAQLKVKRLLEKRQVLQRLLLILALIGTCMVIGDGVLTPALSGRLNFYFPPNFILLNHVELCF